MVGSTPGIDPIGAAIGLLSTAAEKMGLYNKFGKVPINGARNEPDVTMRANISSRTFIVSSPRSFLNPSSPSMNLCAPRS
jgi:hypothetical protein